MPSNDSLPAAVAGLVEAWIVQQGWVVSGNAGDVLPDEAADLMKRIRHLVTERVAAENAACAKVVDSFKNHGGGVHFADLSAYERDQINHTQRIAPTIAAVIRARCAKAREE